MRERIVAWRLDLALVVLGLCFGAHSLFFPFGHDQGVHYYVGREWALRGAIPYRDAFDYKTPGIFVLHALLVLVHGEHVWAIRIAELACVLALGTVCAGLVSRRAPARGFVGFVCFTTFVLYYGYFSFWDTAQCEIWAVTLALASILVVRKAPRWVALSGALAGLTLLMKPPALLIALPAVYAASRISWRALATYAVGFAAPLVLTMGYFAAHHAAGAMVDVLLGADAQYVVGSRRVDSFGEMYEQLIDLIVSFQPFGAILIGALLLVLMRKLGRETDKRCDAPVHAIVLTGLAVLAIAAQLKFYHYHFGLLVGPLVIAIAEVQACVVPERPGLAAVVVAALFGISGQPSRMWLAEQRAAFARATHRMTREAYASRFAFPSLAYDERESEDVGEWLRRNTENEPVLVRGFKPEVYAFAERRAPGRFFWTIPLTDPKRNYNRAAWLAEDERAVATLPRFVVTASDARGIDAVERFRALGYEPCHTAGKTWILARPKAASCDAK